MRRSNSEDNCGIISRGERNIESWLGCIRRGKPGHLNLCFLRAGLPIVVRINQRAMGIVQFQTWISERVGQQVRLSLTFARVFCACPFYNQRV